MPRKQVKVLKTGGGDVTSTLICYVGRTSPGTGQHGAITKVEHGVDSKATVLSFSVTHCFANLFLFRRLGTQRRYSIARASTKDLYEERLICTVSLERLPTCFHTRCFQALH